MYITTYSLVISFSFLIKKIINFRQWFTKMSYF